MGVFLLFAGCRTEARGRCRRSRYDPAAASCKALHGGHWLDAGSPVSALALGRLGRISGPPRINVLLCMFKGFALAKPFC